MNRYLWSTNLIALLGALLLLPACSPSGGDDDDSSSADDDDTADSVPYEFTPVTTAWMYMQTKTTADGTWICDIDWRGEDRSDHAPFLGAVDGGGCPAIRVSASRPIACLLHPGGRLVPFEESTEEDRQPAVGGAARQR